MARPDLERLIFVIPCGNISLTLRVCAFLVRHHAAARAALRASGAATVALPAPQTPSVVVAANSLLVFDALQRGVTTAPQRWSDSETVREDARACKAGARGMTQARTLADATRCTDTPITPSALAHLLRDPLRSQLPDCEAQMQVWIVVAVGVTGTRGRCAAFRSAQDAGDSPSPRCCSKSELSPAFPPNAERHLPPTLLVFDAL